MAHWAEIDGTSTVIRVVVTPNEGDQGEQWLKDALGGTWVKTSYNTSGGVHINGGEPLRKNFAGVGMTYDPIRDAFIPPKPFASWVLNEDTCTWDAPGATYGAGTNPNIPPGGGAGKPAYPGISIGGTYYGANRGKGTNYDGSDGYGGFVLVAY